MATALDQAAGSSTAIWSQPWTELTRLATTITVRPSKSSPSSRWIAASVSASTADSVSSRIRIRGDSESARARAVRWRCPPESITPRSPTRVP